MKKLFIISVVLLATTSLKAQAVIGDTLKTNSQWVKTKAVLPKDVSDVMTIVRNNEENTLVVEFAKHLTQDELELVKNYVRFYYDWGNEQGGYNCNAPDVYNQKKTCKLIFYKRG
jgi:hypothetical protein